MKLKRKIAKAKQMYRNNKKGILLVSLMLASSMPSWAAGQTAAKLAAMYNDTAKPIIRISFIIGCAIAAIRVVLAMMNSGERGNIGSKIGWLIGGVAVYLCWEIFLTDIGAPVSGTGTGN